MHPVLLSAYMHEKLVTVWSGYNKWDKKIKVNFFVKIGKR
jgi:hypothetical protein